MSFTTDNASQNILQLVINWSLENAETFLSDAKLLIENSSFGHSLALMVLALEEVGKAVYCNWARNGLIKVDDDFFKNLKDHKTKQRVFREIERLAILKTEINTCQKTKRRRRYQLKSNYEIFRFITEIEESTRFKSIDAFYGELEKMKQLALYVDVDENGVPSAPSFFASDRCKEYLDFVQKRFTLVKDALLSKVKKI